MEHGNETPAVALTADELRASRIARLAQSRTRAQKKRPRAALNTRPALLRRRLRGIPCATIERELHQLVQGDFARIASAFAASQQPRVLDSYIAPPAVVATWGHLSAVDNRLARTALALGACRGQ